MLKEYAISLLLIATMSAPSLVSGFDSKTSLRCYSEPSGPKYQICDKSFGFQTCFTKYDHSQKIILRGCSSKRKMFHIECESHLSGNRNEQFCYCGYDLCNSYGVKSDLQKRDISVIIVIVVIKTMAAL